MDPISNMIISIKNAGSAGRDSVAVPFSTIKENIAKVLMKERFIKSIDKKSVKGRPMLILDLFSENRVPKVKGVKRISKTSKRVYTKSADIRGVKQGYGLLIMSTPKGIMTGRDAKKEKVGGEALFSIW